MEVWENGRIFVLTKQQKNEIFQSGKISKNPKFSTGSPVQHLHFKKSERVFSDRLVNNKNGVGSQVDKSHLTVTTKRPPFFKKIA